MSTALGNCRTSAGIPARTWLKNTLSQYKGVVSWLAIPALLSSHYLARGESADPFLLASNRVVENKEGGVVVIWGRHDWWPLTTVLLSDWLRPTDGYLSLLDWKPQYALQITTICFLAILFCFDICRELTKVTAEIYDATLYGKTGLRQSSQWSTSDHCQPSDHIQIRVICALQICIRRS